MSSPDQVRRGVSSPSGPGPTGVSVLGGTTPVSSTHPRPQSPTGRSPTRSTIPREQRLGPREQVVRQTSSPSSSRKDVPGPGAPQTRYAGQTMPPEKKPNAILGLPDVHLLFLAGHVSESSQDPGDLLEDVGDKGDESERFRSMTPTATPTVGWCECVPVHTGHDTGWCTRTTRKSRRKQVLSRGGRTRVLR